jgi:hypothetical protein
MTLTGSSMDTTGDDEGYWKNLMATFLLRYDDQLRSIASSPDPSLHFPLHIESVLFPFIFFIINPNPNSNSFFYLFIVQLRRVDGL